MVKILLLAAMLHPLHTSLAELSISHNTISVSLRLFADDLKAVSSSRPFDYASATLVIRDSHGKAVKLTPCGQKQVGDLVWLCLKGSGDAATVESTVMFDRYRDQINVVQASFNGQTRNMLFTPGDRAKRIN